MKWIPLMIKCTIVLWLAYIFTSSLLAWEHHMWEYHLNSNDLLSFGCCLLFRSTLLIALTKHLKCPLDHHFYVSLSSTTLGLPTKGGKPLHIGRSDLSPKNHSWHSHEMSWLIDPCDGLILMSNLKSFFKSFSFYQMISNCY